MECQRINNPRLNNSNQITKKEAQKQQQHRQTLQKFLKSCSPTNFWLASFITYSSNGQEQHVKSTATHNSISANAATIITQPSAPANKPAGKKSNLYVQCSSGEEVLVRPLQATEPG